MGTHIQRQAEPGIAPGTEYSDYHSTVIGLRDHKICHDKHHEGEIIPWIDPKVQRRHGDRTRDQYNNGAEGTGNDRNPDEPLAVAFRPFRLVCPDGLPKA